MAVQSSNRESLGLDERRDEWHDAQVNIVAECMSICREQSTRFRASAGNEIKVTRPEGTYWMALAMAVRTVMVGWLWSAASGIWI